MVDGILFNATINTKDVWGGQPVQITAKTVFRQKEIHLSVSQSFTHCPALSYCQVRKIGPILGQKSNTAKAKKKKLKTVFSDQSCLIHPGLGEVP